MTENRDWGAIRTTIESIDGVARTETTVFDTQFIVHIDNREPPAVIEDLKTSFPAMDVSVEGWLGSGNYLCALECHIVPEAHS